MSRKDIAEKDQSLECPKLAICNLMPFNKSTIGYELTPCISWPLPWCHYFTRIHDGGSLRMREKEHLLFADSERVLEPSHQR